jgi:MFS family permease
MMVANPLADDAHGAALTSAAPTTRSAWAPLRHPAFRAMWIASLISNIGTWMQSTSAAWFMTSLSSSPIMVALMPTATSLPFFLIALPAGALADIVDRRRLLLVSQAWMLIAAALLGWLALQGLMTDWLLLWLTLALGIGAAVMAPAWQSFTPHLVPRPDLQAAVALGGVSMNVARAIGPALGGLMIATQGPGPVFLVNAASFVVVIVVLAFVPKPEMTSSLPPERVIGAMGAGVRFVRHARPLHAVLSRTAAFMVPGSALWALLPLVAKHHLDMTAVGYGLLLGCLGAGAVAGAWCLPYMRRRATADQVLAAASVGFAVSMAVLSMVRSVPVIAAAMVIGGTAWIAATSSLISAAQNAAPDWVRARVLAVALLVLQGSLAAGSAAWGVWAAHATTDTALLAAAAAMLVGMAITWRARLDALDALDLTPAVFWPSPELNIEIDCENVPVLVTLDYEVAAEHERDFIKVMREVGTLRRRDGAIQWGLYRDAARPTRFVETFLAPSWLEHLRQHERGTAADRLLRDRVEDFMVRERQPVSHLVEVDT